MSFDEPSGHDRHLTVHECKRKRLTKNVRALLDYIETSVDPIFWG